MRKPLYRNGRLVGVATVAFILLFGVIIFRYGGANPPPKIPPLGAAGTARESPSEAKASSDQLKSESATFAGDMTLWLESKNHKAKAIVSAFVMKGDKSLLPALEARIADDPNVALTLSLASSDPNVAIAYLERGQELFPDFIPFSLLKAGLLSQAGNLEKAGEVAKAIALSPKGAGPFEGLRALSQEALLFSGISIADTLDQADRAYTTFEGDYFSKVSNVNAVMKSTFGADTDENIAVRVGFAVHLSEGSDPTTLGGMAAIAMEKTALGKLPLDTPYGDTGTTVSQRLEVLETNGTFALKALRELQPFLNNSSKEIQQIFLLKQQSIGSTGAWRWVESIVTNQN